MQKASIDDVERVPHLLGAKCPECGRDTAHDLSPVEGADDVRMPEPDEMRIVCKECGTEH